MENPLNFEIIEALAKQKNYSQLNTNEKKIVDKELDSAEFDAMHTLFVIQTSKPNGIDPDKEILASLQAKFSSTKVPVLGRILSYKIPAYVVATAAILLFMLNFGIKSQYETSNPIQDTITIVKYIYEHPDTVFQKETIANVQQNKAKERKSLARFPANKTKADKKNSNIDNNLVRYNQEVIHQNLAQLNSKPKGRNMNKDSVLLSFLVQTY